jgi:hypothetical protein
MPWRIRIAWAALTVFFCAGVIGLVAMLHPQGKQDPKAIPVALFALTTVFVGSALIARMERPPR